MAVSVALVMLEVARGRFRGTVAAWLGLVVLAFNPIDLGFFSNVSPRTIDQYWAVPIIAFVVVVVSVIVDIIYHRVRLYKLLWIVLASVAGESKLWGGVTPIWLLPHWLWQVILVPIAFGLALKPLLVEVHASEVMGDETAVIV